MDDHSERDSPEHTIASQVAALAALCRVAAWLFSYPDKDQMYLLASSDFIDECRRLMIKATIDDACLRGALTRFEASLSIDGHEVVDSFRVEYTRLFIMPPPLIALTGSCWIKQRTELSRAKGERVAVEEEYRQIGLRRKSDAKEPADHMISQLDYVSYVLDAEAQAWQGGDVVSAREWLELRNAFMENHLRELARGVATEVKRLSDNVILRFSVALLVAVVKSAGGKFA